jgi:SOS-response transcriptional repressor LexA
MQATRTHRPPLTRNEQGVLDSLKAYAEEHDFPPTFRELAEFGDWSTTETFRCIKILRAKGYVTTGPIRTMRVIE